MLYNKYICCCSSLTKQTLSGLFTGYTRLVLHSYCKITIFLSQNQRFTTVTFSKCRSIKIGQLSAKHNFYTVNLADIN